MSATVYKNQLQEHCQKNYWKNPTYKATDHGPGDPAVRWQSEVTLTLPTGEVIRRMSRPAATKVEADQLAARLILEELQILLPSEKFSSTPTPSFSPPPKTTTPPLTPDPRSPTHQFSKPPRYSVPTAVGPRPTSSTEPTTPTPTPTPTPTITPTKLSTPPPTFATPVPSTSTSRTPAASAKRPFIVGSTPKRQELTKLLQQHGFLAPKITFQCTVRLPDGRKLTSREWYEPCEAEREASEMALLQFNSSLNGEDSSDDEDTDDDDE